MKVLAPDFITKCATSQNDALKIIVIGCGGTGSEIASKLFKMNSTLKALGSAGLDVTLIDDDCVSPSNIGRQNFWGVDIGEPKSAVLANRFNNFGGTKWKAVVSKFESANLSQVVVFGCVDNAIGRQMIHKSFKRGKDVVWIDCGNDASSANIFMGMNTKVHGKDVYIPSIYDLFKIQLDTAKPSLEPSCSTSEAISRQDFGVNALAAEHATQFLWQLYRHGSIAYHAISLDMKTGNNTPIEADPMIWEMFGYSDVKGKGAKRKAA